MIKVAIANDTARMFVIIIELLYQIRYNGVMATIVDIDDTLLKYGTQPIEKNIKYVNKLKGRIYIVTGRPQSQITETIKALRDAGVKYDRLIMNPFSTRESNKHKLQVAKKFKDEVSLAIDNDEGARAAYASQGIDTLDPANISADTKKFWQIW